MEMHLVNGFLVHLALRFGNGPENGHTELLDRSVQGAGLDELSYFPKGVMMMFVMPAILVVVMGFQMLMLRIDDHGGLGAGDALVGSPGSRAVRSRAVVAWPVPLQEIRINP
jgi:hypothetical protein